MKIAFHNPRGRVLPLERLTNDSFSPVWLGRKLGGIRRFQGHPDALTVLEHSILCAQLAVLRGADKHAAACCLTHDLSEAFLGDWHGPSKCQEQRAVERAVDDELRRRGWVIDTGLALVHELDTAALQIERQLMWPETYGASDVQLTILPWEWWVKETGAWKP